jgi:hypothetical protein
MLWLPPVWVCICIEPCAPIGPPPVATGCSVPLIVAVIGAVVREPLADALVHTDGVAGLPAALRLLRPAAARALEATALATRTVATHRGALLATRSGALPLLVLSPIADAVSGASASAIAALHWMNLLVCFMTVLPPDCAVARRGEGTRRSTLSVPARPPTGERDRRVRPAAGGAG